MSWAEGLQSAAPQPCGGRTKYSAQETVSRALDQPKRPFAQSPMSMYVVVDHSSLGWGTLDNWRQRAQRAVLSTQYPGHGPIHTVVSSGERTDGVSL